MAKPLVNKQYTLQKFPGKGGWTYVVIDEIPKSKRAQRGWAQVKGTVDGFEIKQYKLMPMKDGGLFFPIKAEIRKQTHKQSGDKVHIILYADESSFETPEEFALCLEDDPGAKRFFFSLSDSEKRLYVLWIYAAKKEETRISRIAESMRRLSEGKKLYDREK